MSDALLVTSAERAAIVDVISQQTALAFDALNQLDSERGYCLFAKEAKGAVSGNLILSFDTHKQKAKAWFRSLREASYVIEQMHIDVLTRDVALVLGRYHFTGTDQAGKTNKATCAWSWVFHRRNGEWKIVHAHVSEPGGHYGPYAS
jgi:uncharacterized protein (TIGR02246 family)